MLDFQNRSELAKKHQEMVYPTHNCNLFNDILSMIFNSFIDRLIGNSNLIKGRLFNN